MGRYRGPSCKICRRNGTKLFLKGKRCEIAKCAIDKRNFPPGPKEKASRKITEFGRRLREKQKIRFYYGVTERQMRTLFAAALKAKGMTGHNLLTTFEQRFDNVVFRSKLARSRKEARQLIRHGHFNINDKKVSYPALIVQAGDKITVKGNGIVKDSGEKIKNEGVPSWLSYDDSKKSVTLVSVPDIEEVDTPVDMQLVVEYYSR